MRKMNLIVTIVFTGSLFLHSSLHSNANQGEQNTKSSSSSIVSVQEDPNNKLGLISIIRKIEEASTLLKEGKINEAEKILLTTKSWLTDFSNYHYDLYEILKKQPKTISASKIEKAHALDFARVRDQSNFLLARVYIIQNKLKEAVDLLIQIIKSQPGSDLANESYKVLQGIKFSDKS